jgi:hypothetical protein
MIKLSEGVPEVKEDIGLDMQGFLPSFGRAAPTRSAVSCSAAGLRQRFGAV